MEWNKVHIIENNEIETNRILDYAHGGEVIQLTKEHIEALQDGKNLAYYTGEYTYVLTLKEGE
jgi:hypothetical protein